MAGRCLALAALAGLCVQGVQLRATQGQQALAELGVHASAASQADLADRADFTPEQRKLLHEQAFEREFYVELDMVEARAKDLYIGVDLDTDTDFTPISVSKIRKSGLVEMWNKQHPRDQVLVGDQITKVNDILWHHNTKTFGDRIKGQFKASKKGKEGAKDTLRLFIQRPRHSQNEGRTQVQRDDLYRRKYPRDFALDIPFVPNQTMGWELRVNQSNSTVDEWIAPSIASISSTGMLALWNQEHPDFRLYPGDEIVTSNGIHWHHNTQTFKSRIETMLERTIREANSTVAMSLHIQRPSWVVEELESKSFEKTFDVKLPYTNGSPDIGLTLESNTSGPVSITDIPSGGWLSSWNEANPTQSLAVGDRIVKANGVTWRTDTVWARRVSAKDLVKTIFGSRRIVGPGTALTVQRKTEFKYARGWIVEIPARAGQLLGLRMNANDDELPVTISAIKPLSAVSMFNEDYPDDAVMPGDHIFKVNDLLWRKDSRDFARRLEQQFAKSRRTGVVRLWVQRPEGLEGEESSSWSAHRYMEYSVELNVSSPQNVGWQLNTTGEGPVVISQLNLGTKGPGRHNNTWESQTSIGSWNEKNALKEIQVGDQVIQIDNNPWHNNTDVFVRHLNHQLADVASSNVKGSVLVLLRRPYATHPMVEGDGNSQDSQGGMPPEDDGDEVMGAED